MRDILHDQLRDFCRLLGKRRTGFICLVAACAGGTVVVEAERQFSVLRQLRTLVDDRYNARACRLLQICRDGKICKVVIIEMLNDRLEKRPAYAEATIGCEVKVRHAALQGGF